MQFTKSSTQQNRRDRKEERKAARQEARQVRELARQQAEFARQQAIAAEDARRQAAQQAHYQAFINQWGDDIRRFHHRGPETLNRVLGSTIYEFYPVKPGYFHNWFVDWEWVDYVGGEVRINVFQDKVEVTQAEIRRQELNNQASNQFWNTVILSNAIRSHNR
jgi:hypothetical protein